MIMTTFESACATRVSGGVEKGFRLNRLNDESLPSRGTFVAMAKKGLLTTDSQEGLVSPFAKGMSDNALFESVNRLHHATMTFEMMEKEYVRLGGTFEDGVQYEKAYLCGLMLHREAERAVDAFNMRSDKIAMIVDHINVTSGETKTSYAIPVTFYRYTSGKVNYHTNVYAWETRDSHAFEVECQGMMPSEADRLTGVVFVDPKPGRKARSERGLYTDVLRALDLGCD